MAQETKTYEVIEPIDFGYALDPTTRESKDKQADYAGYHEPTPEGQDNPTLDLPESLAAQLLEAGSIKPVGEETPVSSENPEEDGYQGEEGRNQALKEDEVYTGKKRGRPAKNG